WPRPVARAVRAGGPAVGSAPARAARLAARGTPTTSAPSPAARAAASAAGASASTMVLSPTTAPPRWWAPSTHASSIATSPCGSSSGRAVTRAARRNAVPYKGPEAPPTVDMTVVAATRRTSETSAGGLLSSSRRATTVASPRARFAPWSPSPICRSSSTSSSLWCSTRAAAPRIQSSAPATPKVIHHSVRRDRCAQRCADTMAVPAAVWVPVSPEGGARVEPLVPPEQGAHVRDDRDRPGHDDTGPERVVALRELDRERDRVADPLGDVHAVLAEHVLGDLGEVLDRERALRGGLRHDDLGEVRLEHREDAL